MKRLVVTVLVTACGGGDSPAIDAPAGDAPSCIPGTPHVVFLNRAGGAYTKGNDDSTTNTSSIINANITLPAPNVVESDWTTFVSCVKSKFTSFAIDITEIDPGTAPHVEFVVIDNAQQIGFGQGTFSVSPFNCNVLVNPIQFLMWNENGADNPSRCWSGSQTIGNGFGLDHAFSCPDLMTFQTNCGPVDQKTFTDVDVPCGEFSARNCCSGPTQNSFQRLLLNAGASCN